MQPAQRSLHQRLEQPRLDPFRPFIPPGTHSHRAFRRSFHVSPFIPAGIGVRPAAVASARAEGEPRERHRELRDQHAAVSLRMLSLRFLEFQFSDSQLGSLNSLLLISFRTALTENRGNDAIPAIPETAATQMVPLQITAGMSTIHYFNVKVFPRGWVQGRAEPACGGK